MNVFSFNLGSSSIKFGFFSMPNEFLRARGKLENINNGEEAILTATDGINNERHNLGIINDHKKGVKKIFEFLEKRSFNLRKINYIGHRIVHGGTEFKKSVIITPKVKEKIQKCNKFAPLHNPINLMGVEVVDEYFKLKRKKQIAVFDTAFHSTMPRENYTYAIPNEISEKYEIRRFGFHGISVKYVIGNLKYIVGDLKNKKTIVCHIGSGASITAVKNGRSIKNSMGFTPLEGLIMATRSGSIDPGIILELGEKGYSFQEINQMLNYKSGILGLYGNTAHMGKIVQNSLNGDKKAKLTLKIFVNSIVEQIGAYVSLMNGVDYIIFTGGVLEKSEYPEPAIIRKMIINKLKYLGITLNEQKNIKKFEDTRIRINKNTRGPQVFVIKTDEELMIAKEVHALMQEEFEAERAPAKNESLNMKFLTHRPRIQDESDY